MTRPALAFPPLPSSFYGTVKINNSNAPDGTWIKALINGHVFAETQTITYQGDSVYSLDVPGDDSSTSVVEGGREGDSLVFIIGGPTASQAGRWTSGTNTKFNLSLFTQLPDATSTPSVTPTETTLEVQPAASPTDEAQSNATNTSNMESRPASSLETVVPESTVPAEMVQSILTVLPASNPKYDSSDSMAVMLTIGIIVILVALLIVVWPIIVRRSKNE